MTFGRASITAMALLFVMLVAAPVGRGAGVERRGCCSHHGGVCSCAGHVHTLMCCDGTLSPSCSC